MFCRIFSALVIGFFSFIPSGIAAVDIFQYLDKSKSLTIQEVMKDPPAFEPVETPFSINYSFNTSDLWIRIDLTGEDNYQSFLIENAHLDSISCYYTQNKRIVDSFITGDKFKFDTRPINSNYFIFPIPDYTDHIYLKINTRGSLSIPMHFFTQQNIIPYLLRENSVTLVYFGVSLVILILNLLLYIRLKENLYFYYFLSVLSTSLMVATNEGYTFKWLWPNLPELNNYVVILYSTSAFLILFSEKFLNLKVNSRSLYWVYRFFYLTLIFLSILNLLGEYNTAIFFINLVVFIITFLFLFSGAYVYIKIRDFSIIYYLIGWGLYAVMAMIYTLSLFGIVPLNIITMKSIQIGGALEMIILFLAIVHKIEVLKKEKSMANKRVIDLLIKQEEYLQGQNKLLEEGVQKKTQELNIQKEKIEHQNLRLRKNREELREKNRKLEETLVKLKETQSQLVSAEKLAVLGQLTAGISHELNNPINFIKSGLEGLKAGMDNLMRIFRMYENLKEDNLHIHLKAIEEEKQATRFDEMLYLISRVPDHIALGVNRATDLVKELRSYIHKDTQKELTDINRSLDSSLILLYNEYKYNITLEKEYGEIPKVFCYPSKVNQVFINVISNAIDAVNEKFREIKTELQEEKIIRIKTQLSEKNKQKYVSIIIQDNGIGMLHETKSDIFVPFKTSKSRGNGLGLGLFISESIIKDHNGFIEFQSEYLKGTTFHIYLPLQ